MVDIIDLVIRAGRSAVDVSLYTLLPIMVVMMIAMRLLEACGLLDRLTRLCGPAARIFGLTGMGVLAMVQISFVSFVAPLPTLALMEDRGASDRQLAAALSAVLAMAPANALFPLAAMGLNAGFTLLLSFIGGLAAAAATYWLAGRRLATTSAPPMPMEQRSLDRPSLLVIINASGAEAIRIVIGIIPMLLVSLLVVMALQEAGAVALLEKWLAPPFQTIGVSPGLILPILTKYLAGSTALVGLAHEMAARHQLDAAVLTIGGAGFLLHPLDLPGVAILLSAGARLSRTALPALVGAIMGIALRTGVGLLL